MHDGGVTYLGQNSHLHCIVPKGGVTKARYWRKGKSKANFLFSVKALSAKSRDVFATKLPKKSPEIPQSLYDKLFSKK